MGLYKINNGTTGFMYQMKQMTVGHAHGLWIAKADFTPPPAWGSKCSIGMAGCEPSYRYPAERPSLSVSTMLYVACADNKVYRRRLRVFGVRTGSPPIDLPSLSPG
jgi:hypothetical protein